MRTKSAAKRQVILRAAAEVFRESGFERSSMAAIRERAGCSKPTLYSYFASKEALFSAVVFEASEAEFQATLAALDPGIEDMTEALTRFGQGALALLYSPQVQAARRVAMAESGRSDLGRQCYALGPARCEEAIAAYLQRGIDRGLLRPCDPRLAAQHFKGLLEAQWLEPFLFKQLQTPPDARALDSSVHRAVEVFMAAYGPGKV